MTRRKVANPLALAVLACLSERPMHPYEISSTLRSRGKELSVKLNYGSLYSVVEALERHGLIRAKETVRQGRRPERTVYEITEAGATECEDWLAELLSTPVREYTSLEAGLSFMPLLGPDEVARLLAGRADRLRMELRALDASAAVAGDMQLPEVFLVEGSYRRALLVAELDFVVDLAHRISEGTLGGVAGWRRMQELMAQGISLEEITQDPQSFFGEEGRVFQPHPPR
ncbi:MAG TPA: PadR family transcriptional regulator [Actinomycetes bacterium]|nr:PadR family transcriptional regulator [Actinomycetes bacterium]